MIKGHKERGWTMEHPLHGSSHPPPKLSVPGSPHPGPTPCTCKGCMHCRQECMVACRGGRLARRSETVTGSWNDKFLCLAECKLCVMYT